MDQIFLTIKKMLGFAIEYEAFDVDLLVHIRMIISKLNQIGVVEDGITLDGYTTWDDLDLEEDVLGLVKDYIYLQTRMVFDPPQSGTIMNALKEQISELEWRLSVYVDPGTEESNG